MNLYSMTYEDDEGNSDGMEFAYEGRLSQEEAYKLAVAQAVEVWGNDEPDSYTTEDIYNLSYYQIPLATTPDGKRRFVVELKELNQ